MIKICENPNCRKEFEPTPQLQHRQRYCPACVMLTPYQRKLQEPIAQKVCKNPACGIVFTPRHNLRDRQEYHTAKCRIEHEHDIAIEKGSKNIKKRLPGVVAICPKCRQPHTVNIEWDQPFPPRLFCPTCNEFRCSERFSGCMCGYNQSCTV